MPWSMGKDSNVLIWLSKKAFGGHIPYPLLHIDTTYEFPEMLEYREWAVKDIRAESDREDQRRRPGGTRRLCGARGRSVTKRPIR